MPDIAALPIPPHSDRARLLSRLAALLLCGILLNDACATNGTATPMGPPSGTLIFEENKGQSAAEVDFLARGLGYNIFLSGGDAVFVFAEHSSEASLCSLRLRFADASKHPSGRGEQLRTGHSNYLSLDGAKPSISDVARFERVRYADLIAGGDLVYYGNEGRLEYDLELRPGPQAELPVLALEGASSVVLGDSGELNIDVCGSHVAFQAPIAYQHVNGKKKPVTVAYRMLPDHRATFVLGAYDRTLPLVIDPVFAYSTCLGGASDDGAFDLALGANGETYIVGYTMSADFPTRGPIHGYGGGQEGFITKLNASGSDVIYSTFVGGNSANQAVLGVAVNGAGEAYLAGTTDLGGISDAFLLKINAAGNGVVFSSVFGGSSYEQAKEVALDSVGNAVVVGFTGSTNFPVLNGLQANSGGGDDAFVRRYSPSGTLLSSTYLGGVQDQQANTVALAANNTIFVGGRNNTNDFNGDAFVLKLNATASSVLYSRTFGGSSLDVGEDLVVDAGSRAYLVGRTQSSNFPTASAVQAVFGGNSDGFLTVLDAAGANFVTSSYLGGSSSESAEGVAIGPGGEVYITGSSGGGSADVFLLKLGANFNTVDYSVQLGPTGWQDYGQAVRVDSSGAAFIAGYNLSGQYFPSTAGAFQTCVNGSINAFVAKIVDGTPSLSVADTAVTEGNSSYVPASFAVSLSAAPVSSVSFSYTTADGSAISPGDYQGTTGAGSLTIPAGRTSANVDVYVKGDTLDEPDETFALNLSSPVGATIVDGLGLATIVDDDAPPSLSVNDCVVSEGNAGAVNCTFTISLAAASGQAVTVNYATADGSAAAPGDYTAGGGTLTFSAGQTSKTVSIAVQGDIFDELNETFTLNLSTPANATLGDGQGLGTITDDDPVPVLAVSDCSVTEGNSGAVNCSFTVSLTAASGQTVTVNYATADGSAVAPGDYSASTGTLTFAAGQASQPVNVAVQGDASNEVNETFTLNLSAPVNATLGDGQGLGIITDDDPVPVLSVSDCSVTEGNSGAVNCSFTVSLTAASGQTVTVNYATADGSAVAPGDYTAGSGTLTFAAGQASQTVSVAVQGDTVNEVNETFTLNLSAPVNATLGDGQGLGTIMDDDPLPVVAVNDCSVTEGNSGTTICSFLVSLTPASGKTVIVNYATADGTAVTPGDYAAHSGALSFDAGQTSQTVNIVVQGDTLDEANEIFTLNLSAPVNATVGDGQGAGTIVDDDQPNGRVRMSECVAEISELVSQIQLSVERVNGSYGAISVNFSTANGSALAGSDYSTRSGVLSWANGDVSARTITVPLINNATIEPREFFDVNLATPTGGAVITTPNSTRVWILDNPDQVFNDDFGGLFQCY